MPVVVQREVPMVRKVRKTLEIVQLQFFDRLSTSQRRIRTSAIHDGSWGRNVCCGGEIHPACARGRLRCSNIISHLSSTWLSTSLAEVFSLKTYKIDHRVHGAIAPATVCGALLGATPSGTQKRSLGSSSRARARMRARTTSIGNRVEWSPVQVLEDEYTFTLVYARTLRLSA